MNLFSFKGRIGVRQYWTGMILSSLIGLIGAFIMFLNLPKRDTDGLILESANYNYLLFFIIFTIFIILTIYSISLQVRRLHDINMSGWWMLLNFIPIVGLIGLLVLGFAKGTDGPNMYGEVLAK